MTQSDLHTRISEAIAAQAGREGPLLPMLHAIQEAVGHVPDEAVPMLADAMQTTTAEIHGVISFYHDFRREPKGRHTLRLCRAESCQALGAAALHEQVRDRIGLDWGETTPDGRLTLEAVYCLGLCACGPAAMLDEQPLGRVDAAGLAAAVAGVR